MAFSKRSGIDKALDQVDRVLENLGKKQIERNPQENKSVQCHTSRKSTKEIVKKARRPRGVLLPRYTIKTGQIKQDKTSKQNKRTFEDNNQDVLSSTPNASKSIKNSQNFTSISHISNIVPQNEKKSKRKRSKRMEVNSSSEEEMSRCYIQKIENYPTIYASSKSSKKNKYNDQETKKKSRETVPHESSKSRISTHAEPTQSSINRMLLTEKIQKNQENIFPYVPVGKQSGSHNCGVRIQQEIGKLKLDPKAALSWNEMQDLNSKNSDKSINNGSIKNTYYKKREDKDCPQLCEEEIHQALKNINKEISEFIVKSI